MKKTIIIFTLLVMAVSFLFADDPNCSIDLTAAVGITEDRNTVVVDEIIRVYDGDTFFCNIHKWPWIIGENIGIRVNGIDTPEMRGSSPEVKLLAQKAKTIVYDCLTNADEVVLKNIQRGKYFRIVADVEFDGKDLAEELIKVGLAKPYDGGTKDEWDVEDVND